MIKVTVEQVENGFMVTEQDGKVWIANAINGYTGTALSEVLRKIFEKKDEPAAN